MYNEIDILMAYMEVLMVRRKKRVVPDGIIGYYIKTKDQLKKEPAQ